MNEPIKLFIGTSSNGEDNMIESAYEYSLKHNTSRDLDIVWMQQTADKDSYWHGWNSKQWSTPFSGFRWGIPQYCNFKGRAIYTDCDMINLRDIADLWNVDIPDDKWMLAKDGVRFGGKEFCVILFDNTKFKHNLAHPDEWKHVDYAHQQYMQLFIERGVVGDLDPKWNCHDGDGLKLDDMWQLHYTNMATQPWRPEWYVGEQLDHPRYDLSKLFWDTCEEARDHGYIPRERKLGNDKFIYDIIGK